jgi:nonspecific dipeptidase
MSRWRHPCLSLHGVEGAFSDPGSKTVIPRKVIGKFSLRMVPNQTIDGVEKVVCDHVYNLWKARNSPNKMKVLHTGTPQFIQSMLELNASERTSTG